MPIARDTLSKLKSAAKKASRHAYCPYSRFSVGAAVLTEEGRIFSACNVENASLGMTICAERSAVFQAVARGARKIRAVAVYTPTKTAAAPCGACRQVINEFGREAEVYSFCEGVDELNDKLSNLLTRAFGPGTF
jgi:cytidine deaminase